MVAIEADQGLGVGGVELKTSVEKLYPGEWNLFLNRTCLNLNYKLTCRAWINKNIKI